MPSLGKKKTKKKNRPFLDAHPGGASRIQMVNGNDLGQFWDIYKLHNRPHVRKLMEEYRIGNLSPADM